MSMKIVYLVPAVVLGTWFSAGAVAQTGPGVEPGDATSDSLGTQETPQVRSP